MLPRCSIAFFGTLGSEVEKRVLQLSDEYAVPVLDLPEAFSLALREQLLMHLRQEKRDELEETLDEATTEELENFEEDTSTAVWQLLTLNKSNLAKAPVEAFRKSWLELPPEIQQKICKDALKKVLNPSMGPAFIQGELLHSSWCCMPITLSVAFSVEALVL